MPQRGPGFVLAALVLAPAVAEACTASPLLAVLDTGIAAGHPAFLKYQVLLWKDFTNGQPKPYDDAGHGTSVADRLAGTGHCGVQGGFPGARLAVAKVTDSRGAAPGERVREAIRWAVDVARADVISVSLGDDFPLGTLSTSASRAETNAAMRYAESKGVLVVVSAGNNGVRPSETGFFSSSPHVLPVGATGRNGELAGFSDPDPELVAWGLQVPAARASGGCRIVNGTSFAAPFVAGAALRISRAYAAEHGEMPSPLLLRDVLHRSADDGLLPYAKEGFGLVNVERALAAVADPSSLPARFEDETAFWASMRVREEYVGEGSLVPG